jgi:hypothetical protein
MHTLAQSIGYLVLTYIAARLLWWTTQAALCLAATRPARDTNTPTDAPQGRVE